MLAGGVYLLTQGTGAGSLNDSLVENLTRAAAVVRVSPEVLALGTLDGQAVLVRGARPDAFLGVEGGEWLSGGAGADTWAAAGASLASRLDLHVGDALTLSGSSVPRLDVAMVSGIFRTGGAADDELLVDLATARFLTGVPAGWYQAIRVETSDPAALLAFLESFRASVHVTGPGVSEGANTEPATDPRLINLYLLHGRGPLPTDYLTEGLNEVTNSVRLVAAGLALLLGVLAVAGIHGVQARAFADRRATVGILRGLGAPATWVIFRAFRESVPVTVLAALGGTAAGFLLAGSFAATSAVLAFGHAVRVAFDLPMFATLSAAVLAAALASEALLLRSALRRRPAESLREAEGVEPPASLEVVLRG